MFFQTIYFSTVLFSTLFCLIVSFVLFMQRRSGEFSRLILSIILLLSAASYFWKSVDIAQGECSFLSSFGVLLWNVFLSIIYILYLTEIISPNWLRWRRLFLTTTPFVFIFLCYKITLWNGVTYTNYPDLLSMLANISQPGAIILILLIIITFILPFSLLEIAYSKKHDYANRQWILLYMLLMIINALALIISILLPILPVKAAYYIISICLPSYLAYNELFVRIRKTNSHLESVVPLCTAPKETENPSINPLFNKLECYLHESAAYANPDVLLNDLAKEMCTNRTTLSQAIRNQGYSNFSTYINEYRINAFIEIKEETPSAKIYDTLYDVGFRSKVTALRNFKRLKNCTPSEYFQIDDE